MIERAVIGAQIEEKLRVRAQRFAIQLPLRYRIRTENTWRRGETINVSSSGVLFRGDYFAESNTAVEVNLMMPAVNFEGAAEVVCGGTIVRAVPSSNADAWPALAVKISQYHLVRP